MLVRSSNTPSRADTQTPSVTSSSADRRCNSKSQVPPYTICSCGLVHSQQVLPAPLFNAIEYDSVQNASRISVAYVSTYGMIYHGATPDDAFRPECLLNSV